MHENNTKPNQRCKKWSNGNLRKIFPSDRGKLTSVKYQLAHPIDHLYKDVFDLIEMDIGTRRICTTELVVLVTWHNAIAIIDTTIIIKKHAEKIIVLKLYSFEYRILKFVDATDDNRKNNGNSKDKSCSKNPIDGNTESDESIVVMFGLIFSHRNDRYWMKIKIIPKKKMYKI